MNIALVGAGVLAEYVIDIISACSSIKISGIYDDRYPNIKMVSNIPLLGTIKDMQGSKTKSLVISIGDPVVRKTIYNEMKKHGFSFPSIIHPSCIISHSAKIEEGVVIGPFSTVLSGSRISKGACLLSYVNVNQNVSIGSFSLVGAGTIFGNGSAIGEGSHIALASILKPDEKVGDWQYVTIS